MTAAPTGSRMLSERHVARLRAECTARATAFVDEELRFLAPGPTDVEGIVAAFFALYDRRPVADNTGGSGFNDAFWLYLVARIANPVLVVESGTHRGLSAWLLKNAAPDAEVHTFDVSHAHLAHREPGVTYHETDWSAVDLHAVDPGASLAFFDDHINQARRIREAYERGFRLLLFDDDLMSWQLHATGHPPVPTVSMLFEDDVVPGEKIEYLRNGRPRSYTVRPEDTFGARRLVEHVARTPDLTPVTRSGLQTGLTVVKLVA